MPIDKKQIREKEKAVVDGIELGPEWNRMFEQRVVFDYDTSGLDKVTSIEGAESMGWCYQCTQCIPVCPVNQAGGEYGPRKIFRGLQQGMDLLTHDDLWKCTTCMNCLRVCPKSVDMIKIMPAVREEAVMEADVPEELQEAFENTFEYGNPLGESQRKRADWVQKAGVDVPIMKDKKEAEYLWFVECYPSYHSRGQDTSSALAKILTKLKVDFGILGTEEKCSCDSQRMAGEVGLFEEFAEYNINTFSKYKFKKIMVTDPHALNAFKKEYPKLGGEYDVIHYTTMLAPMMDKLDLKNDLNIKVTFHDPCYLGRHNGEYMAPRQIIEALPGVELVEMGRCKEQSYCCGGGGGGMWLDGFMSDHINERLSENRVREAVETGADVLAVCCPYEISRFEDAVKSTGNEGKLLVKDIAELIGEAMA